jgi:hypothetical protein
MVFFLFKPFLRSPPYLLTPIILFLRMTFSIFSSAVHNMGPNLPNRIWYVLQHRLPVIFNSLSVSYNDIFKCERKIVAMTLSANYVYFMRYFILHYWLDRRILRKFISEFRDPQMSFNKEYRLKSSFRNQPCDYVLQYNVYDDPIWCNKRGDPVIRSDLRACLVSCSYSIICLLRRGRFSSRVKYLSLIVSRCAYQTYTFCVVFINNQRRPHFFCYWGLNFKSTKLLRQCLIPELKA